MIFSMTGFAAAARELPGLTLNLELRSVNHRYLDVQFRLPEEFRTLESQMRELVVGQLSRGKVDCRLNYTRSAVVSGPAQLNRELVSQLSELNRSVRAVLPEAQPLAVADVLRWPGMLGPEALPVADLQEPCIELLRRALAEFAETRKREGEKLKAMLLERVAKMEVLAEGVAPRIPAALAAFQEKLAARLKEAMINNEDERIRQEIALYASKIDVDEELSRLRTHLEEVRRVLDKGGAAGKRLDFLMQELNREANTLGAKSVDAEVSKVSMELKVLIEQMREQIQNIE